MGFKLRFNFRFASPDWLSSDERGESGSDSLHNMSLPESKWSEEDFCSGAKLFADAAGLVLLSFTNVAWV